MKTITATQRLKVVNELVSSDVAFDADCIFLDIQKGKIVTEKEKQFAELLMDIYRVIHPHFGCKHTDWDEKTFEDELSKRTRINLIRYENLVSREKFDGIRSPITVED